MCDRTAILVQMKTQTPKNADKEHTGFDHSSTNSAYVSYCRVDAAPFYYSGLGL